LEPDEDSDIGSPASVNKDSTAKPKDGEKKTEPKENTCSRENYSGKTGCAC
jgi:hypothetical protein